MCSGVQAPELNIQVGDTCLSVDLCFSLQNARAKGGPQWPMADNMTVGGGQVVKVVDVKFPGDVPTQEFHLL